MIIPRGQTNAYTTDKTRSPGYNCKYMLNGISFGIILIFVFLLLGLIVTMLIPLLLTPVFGTPVKILDEILKLMDLNKEDRVVDLGCGDGRFVLRAHEQYRCKAYGYDLSPLLVLIAKIRMFFKFPFTKDVVLDVESIYKVDLKDFTKVYVFLDEKSMPALEKKFEKYIKNGGEVYSYVYELPNVKGKKVEVSNGKSVFVYTR
jgi:SAM-dependent methyltransferase